MKVGKKKLPTGETKSKEKFGWSIEETDKILKNISNEIKWKKKKTEKEKAHG